MNIGIVIPAHNYAVGVGRILEWIRTSYPVADCRVVVCDDHSSEAEARLIRYHVASFGDATLHQTIGGGKLRSSLIEARILLYSWAEWYHVIETDVIPDTDVTRYMIDVARHGERVGSVGCVYTWKGERCYPTQSEWFRDQHCEQWPGVGRVANVGPAGIPFGFSLWHRSALSLMTDNDPPFVGLDSSFGRKVADFGLRHYRLLDHAVEHVNGGRQSRG